MSIKNSKFYAGFKTVELFGKSNSPKKVICQIFCQTVIENSQETAQNLKNVSFKIGLDLFNTFIHLSPIHYFKKQNNRCLPYIPAVLADRQTEPDNDNVGFLFFWRAFVLVSTACKYSLLYSARQRSPYPHLWFRTDG